MKLEICDNKFFPWKKYKYHFCLFCIRPRGFPCFYWLQTRREMHPLGLYFCLAIYQSVSATLYAKFFNPLWAFPKESPMPYKFCSNGLQELLSSFLIVSRHRFGHFLYMSLKAACFCLLRLKIRETTEYLETISGSSHKVIMIYPTIPLMATLRLVRQSL
jgi:hypothetical protein